MKSSDLNFIRDELDFILENLDQMYFNPQETLRLNHKCSDMNFDLIKIAITTNNGIIFSFHLPKKGFQFTNIKRNHFYCQTVSDYKDEWRIIIKTSKMGKIKCKKDEVIIGFKKFDTNLLEHIKTVYPNYVLSIKWSTSHNLSSIYALKKTDTLNEKKFLTQHVFPLNQDIIIKCKNIVIPTNERFTTYKGYVIDSLNDKENDSICLTTDPYHFLCVANCKTYEFQKLMMRFIDDFDFEKKDILKNKLYKEDFFCGLTKINGPYLNEKLFRYVERIIPYMDCVIIPTIHAELTFRP